jgi:hypothetical protein
MRDAHEPAVGMRRTNVASVADPIRARFEQDRRA